MAQQYRHGAIHWLQYVPEGLPGPKHWLGKPAALARNGIQHAGLYIERGRGDLSKGPTEKLDKNWHWHGLEALIDNEASRLSLQKIMDEQLSGARSFWCAIHDAYDQVSEHSFLDLGEMQRAIATAPENGWIEVVLGFAIPKSACLNQEASSVTKIQSAIAFGFGALDLCKSAMP